MKIFRNLLKFGLALLLLPVILKIATFASADYSPTFTVKALDTVVGIGTYLEAAPVNNEVLFQVVKPNNEIVKIPSGSPYLNSARVEFPDKYTDIPGTYRLFARYMGVNSNVASASFKVLDGQVSVTKSVVSPSDQMAHVSDEKALITVKLADDFGNPISGHAVKLISESSSDKIESKEKFTNTQGEIKFYVSSSEKGVRSYTAFDLSSDQILSSRAKVVFFDENEYVFSNPVPKNFLFAAIGSPSGETESLEFKDIQDNIAVGSPISFTIEAIDENDQTIVDYDGTVRFSVAGGNASYVNLPADYTFVPEDIGKHTFSIALSFQKAGSYKIEARDLNDLPVFGEYDFVIGAESSSAPSATTITLLSPTSGKTNSASQLVSGTAPAGSNIRIFDNDVKIADIKATLDGKFSQTTTPLTDGAHSIYAAIVNEVGTVAAASSKVQLAVDTAAPSANKVEILPASVEAGGVVEVRLYSGEQLSKAVVSFQANLYEMTDENLGYFKASLPAPIEFGEYGVSFMLSDQLGNETKFEHTQKIKVGPDLTPKSSVLIGNVANLLVKPSDHRLTLNWSAPLSHQNPISNYRVYYGLSPNQLTEVVDTFTPATTWYIPNIKNDVEYYVAVVAMDVAGNVSANFSNIVSARPGGGIVNDFIQPDVYNGTAGALALEEMQKDPSEAGPALTWLISLSLLAGYLHMKYRKRILAD